MGSRPVGSTPEEMLASMGSTATQWKRVIVHIHVECDFLGSNGRQRKPFAAVLVAVRVDGRDRANRRREDLRYARESRLAVGSQGSLARRLASNASILSRCSSVTSMSSMPRIRRSLRSGLISKSRRVPSGAITL
jgi:hypothetical protein